MDNSVQGQYTIYIPWYDRVKVQRTAVANYVLWTLSVDLIQNSATQYKTKFIYQRSPFWNSQVQILVFSSGPTLALPFYFLRVGVKNIAIIYSKYLY